ncbi:MAG: hydroxyisourate hydrolase [Verrucomicrobia bacterium]|nr:hydroxyisourate hydrolase [Verrucomicrobiota bacterium]MBV8481858.1 hydroxyisourate hydrolase [Verrucomicrobiota bacterium]
MSGNLSTHVLDTANGRPAAGLKIQLWRIESNERQLVKEATTNQDGRTDSPLLAGDELKLGVYELVFQVGTYFLKTTEETFLGDVPVRFRILNSEENYHVPLLVSPWSYTTYRGS